MPTFTDIYKINETGEISFHACYSLPKELALKSAAIQLAKRYDTWNYHKMYVPLIARKNEFYFSFGENSMLFTRNERIESSIKERVLNEVSK